MTWKHFIEIAESFNSDITCQLGYGKPEIALAVYDAAAHLCACFKKSNSNFDAARFRQALVVNITGGNKHDDWFLQQIELGK